MNIIYIHGLDSDANSIKGRLLDEYCQQNHPEIRVVRPDLNQTPAQVFSYLTDLVTKLGKDAKTVLIGSSLGGYFSTLVSNATGCPALLLNPSTQPHITLQRFEQAGFDNQNKSDVLYTTTGGWEMTAADLQWFAHHQLLTVHYPNKVAALIKDGDELLDAKLSTAFYREQGAAVILQEGGDHRFSDFAEHLPKVIEMVQQLV